MTVVIGHKALRHHGPLLWAAIVGLLLSYLEAIFVLGLLAVRLTLTFSGM